MADKTTTKVAAKAAAKKTTKAVEGKTEVQLQEELVQLRHDYQESQRSHRLGELVNPHVLTVQRKAIARTLTALTQTASAAKEEN